MMCEFCLKKVEQDDDEAYWDEDIVCHGKCLPDDWDSGMGRP